MFKIDLQGVLDEDSQFGIYLSYKVQETPNGLAQTFVLGGEFISDDSVCLILGDNIFYGNGFGTMLRNVVNNTESRNHATVFGVAEFDKNGKVISLEEKSKEPKSNYAVVGLYFYDNRLVEYAKSLKPSARGEYEITDLNKIYLENRELDCQVFGRGFAWLDTGTVDSLAKASDYVKLVVEIQGIRISVPEEIAYYNKWIDEKTLLEAAETYGKSPYGEHLRKIAKGNVQTTYLKEKKMNYLLRKSLVL